jgi:hypothetical protein
MNPEVEYLPVESDFIDPRSRHLDDRHAVKMFLGKTLDEAEEMFRRNFLFFQEDLTYMRPVAFRFYVLAAIRYLVSAASTGDSDAASTFCHVLEQRFTRDPEALKPIAEIILDTIRRVLDGFARYDCSSEIYGDVQARYRKIEHELKT